MKRRLGILLASLFVALASTPAEARKFPLYNLSILLPLPSALEDAMGLAAEGCRRPFLAPDLFAEIPALAPTRAPANTQYRDVRLVGIRFDLKADELRLVFQPLYVRNSPTPARRVFLGDDAAIHLFFRMPRADLIAAQRELAVAFPGLAPDKLGVHPGIRGVADRAKLKRLLCDVAARSLFKVTFMNVRGGRILWNFGGFLVDESANGRRFRRDDVVIRNADGIFRDPGDANMSVQQVARLRGGLRAQLRPRVNAGDHMMEIFDATSSLPMASVREIRRAVDRIENPRLNSPDTVDCASCHATESARFAVQRHVPQMPASVDAYPLPAGYSLDESISPEVLANTINFRAFGYLDEAASINRRVLNETVEMQRDADSLGAPDRFRARR